jgi:phosphatidylglycerol:prolipoprotein diacylglycerol transferase
MGSTSLVFFGFSLPLYGLFLSLAHFIGFFLLLWQAKQAKKRPEDFVDLAFFVALSGLIGGRLGYIWDHPQEFSRWQDVLDLNRGGLSFFLGFALAFPVYIGVLKWKKLKVLETSDFLTPVLPASLAILRLGCFGAGCCYGTPTDLPWGVMNHFSGLPASLEVTPLHPAQLYESAFLFLLAGIFFWLPKSWKIPAGAKAAGFLLAYSSFRIATIPLRGDIESNPLLGFATVYLTSGILFFSSLTVILVLYRKDPLSLH